MAEFLTTKGIASGIEHLIINAKSNLIIVSPYLKFPETLFERLKLLSDKKINFTFVYGKEELNYKQNELLKSLDCNVYFKENLHAKCYLNDDEAIITSMNLHAFSEANNFEMGIKVKRSGDRKVYDDCYKEIQDIISLSKAIKIVPQVKKEEVKKEIVKTPVNNGNQSFDKNWFDLLNKTFPEAKFRVTNKDFSLSFIANNFPYKHMNVSNEIGIISVIFDDHVLNLKKMNETHFNRLENELQNYRCYWSSPYNKISIYRGKNFISENFDNDLQYYINAATSLIKFVKSLPLNFWLSNNGASF